MSNLSRKKFLFSGLSLAAVATFFKWGNEPEETKKTAKFLTQDGKLVEIELDRLPTAKKAASKEDVQTWIKK
ncbi:MAG TPA: hypothetical protein VFU05_07325 [Cyclobacteriaceae bacterium]|nr:hypothetical protein [Cyclobacteriaceae bacterium]